MAVTLSSYRNAAVGSTNMKVVITCLESGKFIPVHRPGVDMLLLVAEGEGRVTAGERAEAAGPEILIFAPVREARAIKAHTRIVVRQVVSPPPTDPDHAELAAHLKEKDQR